MVFAFKINTALKKHIFVKKSQVHWGWKKNNLDFQTKSENNPDSKRTQARSLNVELRESGLTEVKQNRKQNPVMQKKIYITALAGSLILLHFIFTRFLNQAFWMQKNSAGIHTTENHPADISDLS